MDHDDAQTITTTLSLKRKLDLEFEGQEDHRKLGFVEDLNKDGIVSPHSPITFKHFSFVIQIDCLLL